MYSYIEGHTDRVVLVGEHSENDYAVSELGAVMVPDLTAKAIVVGNYVYIGSINLDYTSLHQNRELGIIIENPVIAEEVRGVILQWYSEYVGQAPKPTTNSNSTSTTTTTPPPTSTTHSTSTSTILVAFFIIAVILYAVVRLRRRRYW
jgi:hypothetical protein